MGKTSVRWEKPAYSGKNQRTLGKTTVRWEKPPYDGKPGVTGYAAKKICRLMTVYNRTPTNAVLQSFYLIKGIQKGFSFLSNHIVQERNKVGNK